MKKCSLLAPFVIISLGLFLGYFDSIPCKTKAQILLIWHGHPGTVVDFAPRDGEGSYGVRCSNGKVYVIYSHIPCVSDHIIPMENYSVKARQ